MIADTNEVRLFQESTTFEEELKLEVKVLEVVSKLKVKAFEGVSIFSTIEANLMVEAQTKVKNVWV